eukprot:TRINITY_DN6163_c0_g1_i2.p1 TRINITY_DN6163_c0_g1~~TRINITY_DN6163_c0_g1_i2.p1  ORF type:complete len:579 (+),score=138.73 TRINITY_DN6163_c0_g1_i2:166-1902(+)
MCIRDRSTGDPTTTMRRTGSGQTATSLTPGTRLLRTNSNGSDIVQPPVALKPRRKKKGKAGRKGGGDTDPQESFELNEEQMWAMMQQEAGEELVFEGVVKIFATIQEPDYGNPWQTQSVENATGSGVVVQTDAGLRILTAAHVVSDQTFLQVQRPGTENPDKHVAGVYAVCHECDLALLEVQKASFWEGMDPCALARLPSHRDLVLVAGFPVGGEELSVTEGVVSRIEGQPYSHSERFLLAVTVDAAINSGNSGGPVFSDTGELVGIAFQAMSEGAENVGHIVPPPVIEHFLEGVAAHGPDRYLGFPSPGLSWQPLTNPYLRASLSLDDATQGVLVTDVKYGNTCHGSVLKGDVITHVGGKGVANNGTVPFDKHGRVDLDIVFTFYQCHTDLQIVLIREGKPLTVDARLLPVLDLVPLSQHDRAPSFFIYCGCVFQPLSLNYVQGAGSGGIELVNLLETGSPSETKLQVVVMSQCLSDEINIGYDELVSQPITKLNGHPIRDLADLATQLESCPDTLVFLETSSHEKLVLPGPTNPDTRSANRRILQRYKVRADRSKDMPASELAEDAPTTEVPEFEV